MSVWNCKVYCIFVCRSFPTRDIHLRFHAHRSIALHRLTESFQIIVNLMIYLPGIHPPYTIHLVTYLKKKQDCVAYIMLKKSKM